MLGILSGAAPLIVDVRRTGSGPLHRDAEMVRSRSGRTNQLVRPLKGGVAVRRHVAHDRFGWAECGTGIGGGLGANRPAVAGRVRVVLALVVIATGLVTISAATSAHAAFDIAIGKVRPLHNGSLCFDLPNPSGTWPPSPPLPPTGTQVVVHVCHGNTNQLFQAEHMTHGVYRIRSTWSLQCLAIQSHVANDQAIFVEPCRAPQANDMRQGWVLIKQGDSAMQLRPAIPVNAYYDQEHNVSTCADVGGSGGAGTPVWQHSCGISSVGQTNQAFYFDVMPSIESGDAHDGQLTNVASVPWAEGKLLLHDPGPGGDKACSAASVKSFSGFPDLLITARHCWEDAPDPDEIWFWAGYDDRASPQLKGYFHVDGVISVAQFPPQGGEQDVVFMRLGGMYNPNGTWNGALLHTVVGYNDIHFSPPPAGKVYTYGYPRNLGLAKGPIACANPWSSGSSGFFRVDCEGSKVGSGSPWMRWNVAPDIRAVTSGFGTQDFSSTGGTVRVPNIQNSPWLNAGASAKWLLT